MRFALGLAFLGALLAACGGAAPAARLHGPIELVLLHTADTHSMLFPYRTLLGAADARHGLGRAGALGTVGGFARLATLLRAARSRAQRVLHFDAGDLFQGSLTFERFGGEPEVRAFDALGVDAQTLGNHELDQGAELVRDRYQTLARFPLLAVNYPDDGEGGLSDLLQPFVVLEAGGLRVGVIGVGNASSVALLKERPNELGVLARDAAGAVQGALDTLRPLVDLTVVVTHLGLDADLELVRRTSGIDLVLGGHQHLTLDEPQWEFDCGGSTPGRVRDAWGRARACSPRRVPVVHSGAYAKTFGKLTLSLDDDPALLGESHDPIDGYELTALALEIVPVAEETTEDPALAELLEPFRGDALEALALGSALAYLPRPLERAGATGGDSPLGNVAAEALREAAQADVAVLGASSLRHDLPPGLLDLEGLERAAPFDDPLVRVGLTGRALLHAFEQAARSASARDCRTQIHVAGALVRFRCPCEGASCARVFANETDVPCAAAEDCTAFDGACSTRGSATGRCFAPLDVQASYQVATGAYLADGGSGLFDFIPETARTPVSDSLAQALADELRGAAACASPSADCASGCAADVVRRSGDACESLGLGPSCSDPRSLCQRAVAACRSLPCLDEAAGAARDGRIRFEAP